MYVEQNEVRNKLEGLSERLFAILRLDDLIADRLERRAGELASQRKIVRNQNALLGWL